MSTQAEQEAWLAANTAYCARLKMRINPQRCDIWRAPNKNGWGYNGEEIYRFECRGCPGPVWPEPKKETLPELKPAAIPTTRKEGEMKIAERTVDISDIPAYVQREPSSPSSSPVLQQPTNDASKQQPKHKYHCEVHGPHSGYNVPSGGYSKKCPQCAQGKRLDGLKKTIYISLNSKPWLLAWLEKEAGEMGGDADVKAVIVRKLTEQVPAEWLKQYIIDNA